MYTTRITAHRSRSSQPATAEWDPGQEEPFGITVLPEQFFNSRVSLATVCPETALMYAVLEDAFLCFQRRFENERRSIQRARQAEEWFFSDDSRCLFSFVSVCAALGLEPGYIRQRLKHWSQSCLGHARNELLQPGLILTPSD